MPRVVLPAMFSRPVRPSAFSRSRSAAHVQPPAPLGQVHGHDLDGEGEALQQGHDLAGRGPFVIAGEPALGLVALDEPQGVVLGQLVDGQQAVAERRRG